MGKGRGGRAADNEPITPERAKLIHNERVKPTASTVDGVALALIGGGVATIAGPGTIFGVGDQFARAAIWLTGGVALPFAVRRHPRALR